MTSQGVAETTDTKAHAYFCQCTSGRSLRPLTFSFTLQGSTAVFFFHCGRHLDDGTLIGPWSSLTTLLTLFSQDGPAFGLHLNLAKCEIFWPSGDSIFPEFPVAVRRVSIISGGVKLLGCPVWGVQTSILIVLTEVFSVCLRFILYLVIWRILKWKCIFV